MPRVARPVMTASNKRYQEDEDARTLADSSAIRADKKRMAGAKRGAKRIIPEVEDYAKNQTARARALKRIAK